MTRLNTTDTEGKQRKGRVWNIFKNSEKNRIFNEHPVAITAGSHLLDDDDDPSDQTTFNCDMKDGRITWNQLQASRKGFKTDINETFSS